MACALHHGAAGRAFATHEQSDAHQAFVAHHQDRGGSAVFHHVLQRDDRVRGEVDMAHGAPRFVHERAQRKLNQLQIGKQPVLNLW